MSELLHVDIGHSLTGLEDLTDKLKNIVSALNKTEAYRGTTPPKEASEIPRLIQALEKGLDLLTFSASSTVSNFVELIGVNRLNDARNLPVASIGPLTTRTCQKFGLNGVIEPRDSTLEALIDSIVEYYS